MNTLLTQGAVLFQGSKKTVIFSSLVVFTLVLEEILESVVFCCPCENHLVYGLLFLLGPSLILFAAGLLMNPNTWWLGSVQRFSPKNQSPNKYRKRQYRRTLILIGEILSKALISPTIWLILSFLQKTFFVCAAFGPGKKRGNPSKDTIGSVNTGCDGKERSLGDEAQLMAKSQFIGLVLSIIGTVLFLLCAFVSKCCGSKSKVCLPDEKFYVRIEAIEAGKEFHRRAKQEAKNQGKKAVDKVFQEMAGQNQDNYLALITIAAKKLDTKYASYYSSSQDVMENSPDSTNNPEDQNNNNTNNNLLVKRVRLEENLKRNAFFVVDGHQEVGSARCDTETHTTIQSEEKEASITHTTIKSEEKEASIAHTTIQSEEKEASITHTQSGITRVCLRRWKSMNEKVVE